MMFAGRGGAMSRTYKAHTPRSPVLTVRHGLEIQKKDTKHTLLRGDGGLC